MVSGYGDRRMGLLGLHGLALSAGLNTPQAQAALGNAEHEHAKQELRGRVETLGTFDQAELQSAQGLELSGGERVLIIEQDSGNVVDAATLERLCAEQPGSQVVEIKLDEYDRLKASLDTPLVLDTSIEGIRGLRTNDIGPRRAARIERDRRLSAVQAELLAKLRALPIATMTQEEARAAVEEIREQYAPILNLQAPGSRPQDFAARDRADAKRAAKAAKRLRARSKSA